MQILMTGIDHSGASVEVRELFSFTSREKEAFFEHIKENPIYDGCILLTTCNRTELWITCEDEVVCDLPKILCEYKNLDAEEYRHFFVSRSGEDAISFLFEVACGLHSLIIGEDQILAQVKKALSESREANACGSVLDVLFRSAVTSAKKVKTDLSLSTANASAVDYAIEYLQKSGMNFEGRKCMVIGNGEMGKRAASALIALGADVSVTIRQYRSGIVEVIPGCKRINYTDRYQLIPECDIVVSATSSPNVTIHYEDLVASGVKPETVFIDLAVPRDIDPSITKIEGITLMDIDSFSVTQTEELRKQVAAAHELISDQQTKFLNWFECRDLLPVVDEISKDFGGEAFYRMGPALKEMSFDKDKQASLNAAVAEATEKELKKLLFAVRDKAGADVFRQVLSAIKGDLANV